MGRVEKFLIILENAGGGIANPRTRFNSNIFLLPGTRQIKVFRFLAGVAMLHVDWVCSVECSLVSGGAAAAYLRTSREFNEITDECGDVSRLAKGEHETQELNVH